MKLLTLKECEEILKKEYNPEIEYYNVYLSIANLEREKRNKEK
jgi:hypothetical protein